MKILAFVDLHADAGTLKKLVKRGQEKDIDLVVCAGDFTVFERHMDYVLKKLHDIGKTVLLVPGNHETPERIEKEIASYTHFVQIHEKLWRIGDWVFLGWGTDGFSLRSDTFRQVAREWRRQLTPNDKKIVLVTHAPPHKTVVDELYGDHVGNADIRKEIERIKPRFAICGHVHENEGKEDKIGETRVVNPGWKGMVIELG